MARTRLIAAGMVAALLAGASGGCRRDTVTAAPSARSSDRPTAGVPAVGCDSVLPMAGAAQLPVLHRPGQRDSENFVTTAAAFRGDARVGRAAWWIRAAGLGGSVQLAGAARLVVAGQTPGPDSWTVGGASLRNPADRWARESKGSLPLAGSFVEVPEPVVVGSTVITSMPEQVWQSGTSRTVAVVCGIDATNGHTRWGTQVPYPASGSDQSVTLLATGGTVVLQFGQNADLVALTAATGRQRWHVTTGLHATVTASGGQVVLSPGYTTDSSRNLTEVRALDLGDGHLAWHHPAPSADNGMGSQMVVATAAGQPVVVRESAARLVGYAADGSVRWKQPVDPKARINAVEDLLLETGDSTESVPLRMAARRVTDGGIVWRARLDPLFNGIAASGNRLFLARDDLRSLLVLDRHSGTVATSLAGVMMNVGKSGLPPDLTVVDRTLMVGVADTAVGFELR